MLRLKILIILPIVMMYMQGCVYLNDEGVGTRLYHDCTEYYDAEGIYHRECDKNLVDYNNLFGNK